MYCLAEGKRIRWEANGEAVWRPLPLRAGWLQFGSEGEGKRRPRRFTKRRPEKSIDWLSEGNRFWWEANGEAVWRPLPLRNREKIVHV